jgi:hypothetical protein
MVSDVFGNELRRGDEVLLRGRVCQVTDGQQPHYANIRLVLAGPTDQRIMDPVLFLNTAFLEKCERRPENHAPIETAVGARVGGAVLPFGTPLSREDVV